ncbi:MAG TPA: twin-arginine translocase subunit TatC [Puia sp.]|jgi:sec-independent protein translocase protein TatC|nr:twin-arginine translocase subunit TatC [Puia sp.]
MALNLLNRNPGQDEMSFIDHLEALRWHIVRSAFAIVIVAIVIFIKIDWIFDRVISGPIRNDFVSYVGLCNLGRRLGMHDALCLQSVKGLVLQTTQFGSQFISSINIAIVGGFVVAFPYVFWELWRFIRPALSPKELKSSRGAIWWVSFFFLLGVAFGYFLLAPFTFSFLYNYTMGSSGTIVTHPTLDDYVENLVDIIIGSGIAFQLPLISYVLTTIGLITPKFLRTYRKYAYVAILFIAAIITPSPDWMSQTIVALPLILLYELSIRVSVRVTKRQEARDKEEWS